MTEIFENDFIKVSMTGHDYDFIAVIENKTDKQICVHYNTPGYNDVYDPILIAPNNWIGLLADEEGRDWIKTIKNNQIYVITNDDELCYSSYYNTNIANSNQLVTVLELLKKIR